jgi:hypothetical protein
MDILDIEKIARVCHEANRAWCVTLGDRSQPAWDDAPEWMVKSAIDGVRAALSNKAGAAGLHNAWCEAKRRDGWVFGPVKDAVAKTHPCLVPYDDLPAEQRAKDALFEAVVGALRWSFADDPLKCE